MNSTITRRFIVSVLCLSGITLWAGPTQAAPETFQVQLTGAQQVPAVQTDGTGTASLTYDPSTREISWTITYSGLSGPVTMAHFHGPAVSGKNAPPTLWLTKRGSPAESPIKGHAKLSEEQAKQFAAGEWYVNIHTKDHPAGEIRGQVTPHTG